MKTGEEQLQSAIVQHLKLRAKVIYYHPANGGLRSKRTAIRMKAMGVVAGVPDLAFVLSGGQAAFVEMKSPSGRLSKEQSEFMRRCIELGAQHAVCADIDSALSVLTEWGVFG